MEETRDTDAASLVTKPAKTIAEALHNVRSPLTAVLLEVQAAKQDEEALFAALESRDGAAAARRFASLTDALEAIEHSAVEACARLNEVARLASKKPS